MSIAGFATTVLFVVLSVLPSVAVDSRRPQVLSPGDEVILRTPGGGGYGAAEERSDALRSYDRLHGYTDV